MMDCRQFREIADLYLDRELAPESQVAADHHLRDCPQCAGVVSHLTGMRTRLREHVRAQPVPPDLEARARLRIEPPARWFSVPAWAAAAAVLLVVGAASWMTLAGPAGARNSIARALETVSLRIGLPSEAVTLEATVLCRDCELEKRYGVRQMCETIGHHGALVTADGRIWNIVQQPESAALIEDQRMLGQKVRVHGVLYREAASVAVSSYEVLGQKAASASAQLGERVFAP